MKKGKEKPTALVANLEEYLIDFSKKAEGYRIKYGGLPPDLDADKFFEMIRPYYRDDEMLQKVREYPVTVSREDESYVLILCDKSVAFTSLPRRARIPLTSARRSLHSS